MFTISVSSLDTYRKCPKKYFYRYVEKTKVPYRPRAYFDVGHLVHKSLQYFHERWTDPNQDKYQIMSQAFADARGIYKFGDHTSKDSKDLLIDYLNKIDRPVNVVENGTEIRFKEPLSDDVYLIGMIDRIDKNNDRYHVVDYKTGKTDVTGELQLKSYAYAVAQMMNVTAYPITASLVSLKLNKTYRYEFYKEDLEDVKLTFLEGANDIATETKWPANPTGLCWHCDYNHICNDAV